MTNDSEAKPIRPLVFPLVEAAVPSLVEADITLFHSCIEKAVLYFLAHLPTTASEDGYASGATMLSIESIKRLILRMVDVATSTALPHILELLFDFTFSPEADGTVRPCSGRA